MRLKSVGYTTAVHKSFFLLRAWQPAAAKPAAKKTRAAAGGEESDT